MCRWRMRWREWSSPSDAGGPRGRVGDESSQLRRGAPLMADLRGLKFEILEFFLSVAILYFFHDCFPLCAN